MKFIASENATQVDAYFDDVTMTFTLTNIIQYNEYYPFGLQTSTSWTRDTAKGNQFLYNAGSELDASSGWYEMFHRGYDPATGRMNQIDPMAAQYHDYSPYHYALNNPVMVNDPSGAKANDPWGSKTGLNKAIERLEVWSDWVDEIFNSPGSKGGGGGSGANRSWYWWSMTVSQEEALAEFNLIVAAKYGDVDALNAYVGKYGVGGEEAIAFFANSMGSSYKMEDGYAVIQPSKLDKNGGYVETSKPYILTCPSCNFWNTYMGRDISEFGNDVSNTFGRINADKLGYAGLGVDILEIGSAGLRSEMLKARILQGGINNVGKSGNLRTMYWLGQSSKTLGSVGYAAAGLSVMVDGYSYKRGALSGSRFSYNTFGTFTSIGIGFQYGGLYGAGVGEMVC